MLFAMIIAHCAAVSFVFRFTGKTTLALNMSSYNYLGFVENNGPCLQLVEQCVRDCGVGVCSVRQELGIVTGHNND